MNEKSPSDNEKTVRLRDKLQFLEEMERDHRLMLNRDIDQNNALVNTLRTSRRTALIGVTPSIFWCISEQAIPIVFSPEAFVSGVSILVMFGIFALAIGSASGLFAFYWFRNTSIPVGTTAKILACLGNVALFGWVVYMTN